MLTAERTISFDGSTDGGAAMRHYDRLAKCCGLLDASGIAPEDLHKWSDVLDTNFAPSIPSASARGSTTSPQESRASRSSSIGEGRA